MKTENTQLDKLKQAAENSLKEKFSCVVYPYLGSGMLTNTEDADVIERNTNYCLTASLEFATSESAREYWLSQSKYKQVRLLTSLSIETADKYVKLQEKKSSEEWVNINDKTPIAYETGVCDGKRSDFVLVECKDEKYHVCKSYEGTMDGFKFLEFCDDRDFQVTNIIRWKYIK